MRWIFQLMEGIGLIKFFDSSDKCVRRILTNLSEVRKKIVTLLGDTISQIYGIPSKIAGMWDKKNFQKIFKIIFT